MTQLDHVEVGSRDVVASVDFLVDGVGLHLFGRSDATAVLRSCADPYGPAVLVTPSPVPGVRELAWRTAGPAALEEAARRIDEREGLSGSWLAATSERGRAYRFRPSRSHAVELRWEVARSWSGAASLACPLHGVGGARGCVTEAPHVDHVGVRGDDNGVRSIARLLGMRPDGSGREDVWRPAGRGAQGVVAVPAAARGGDHLAVTIDGADRLTRLARRAVGPRGPVLHLREPGGLRLAVSPASARGFLPW